MDPTLGQPGELPPWWPNGYPPESQRQFLRRTDVGGPDLFYLAMYGTPDTGRDPKHIPVYKGSVGLIADYQEGALGGMTGGMAFQYSAVWRRVNVAGVPPAKPRAKKRWEDLSPGYRRDISGTMRNRLKLKTEAQFKNYYENAEDLSLLRRHKARTFIVKGLGRISFPQGKDPNRWLATWGQS